MREDVQRSLLGELLMLTALCRIAGVRKGAIRYTHNAYGKPILQSPPNLHYNVSHSGRWVVCGISDSRIGVDIEAVEPIEAETIARDFFTAQEHASIVRLPEGEMLMQFYKIWTLKESYIKAKGMGMSIPLDSFSVIAENGETKLVVHRQEHGLECGDADFDFHQSFLDNKTAFAVCTEPKQRVHIRHVTAKELIDRSLSMT